MRAHRFLLRKRFFFFPENEAMRAASDRRKYIDFPAIILIAFHRAPSKSGDRRCVPISSEKCV